MAKKEDGLMLWGAVVREIEMKAPAAEIFSYLAETGTLVSRVPLADRIVLSPDGQRGQVFFTVRGLGKTLKVTLSVASDAATDQARGLVKISPAATMLVEPEAETLVGRYTAWLRVLPTRENLTRVLCKIEIGVDLSPLKWVHLVPRPLLAGPVHLIFQQRMEGIFDQHLQGLQRYFPKWQALSLNKAK